MEPTTETTSPTPGRHGITKGVYTPTPEQRADSDRLRTIWKAKKEKNPSLHNMWLAKRCGYANASSVSTYMSGKQPLTPRAVAKFAAALDVPPEDISPTLAPGIPKDITPVQESAADEAPNRKGNGHGAEAAMPVIKRGAPNNAAVFAQVSELTGYYGQADAAGRAIIMRVAKLEAEAARKL